MTPALSRAALADRVEELDGVHGLLQVGGGAQVLRLLGDVEVGRDHDDGDRRQPFFLAAAQNVGPSMMGMLRSSRMRQGRSLSCRRLRASSPLAAVATR